MSLVTALCIVRSIWRNQVKISGALAGFVAHLASVSIVKNEHSQATHVASDICETRRRITLRGETKNKSSVAGKWFELRCRITLMAREPVKPEQFAVVLPKLGHNVDDNGRPFTGRPLKLTDHVATKICTALRLGAHQGVAAVWAGIPVERMSRWMHATGEPYESFQAAVKEAEAWAELKATGVVTASKDAKDAIAFLERRFPKRWNRVPTSQTQNILAVMDLGKMLERIEQRRNDPQAPRDPRPPRVLDVQDAELVPALPEGKPKREPVL
jgi:hypothetical protein